MARIRAAVRTKFAYDTIEKLNQKLIQLSTRDALTGLYNRRYFDEQFPIYLSISKRKKNCVSVFMIDIDFFKKYNDAYGHIKGDECLGQVSSALSAIFQRGSDIIARYGGEEFIACSTGMTSSGAKIMTNKLIEKMSSMRLEHAQSEYGPCYGKHWIYYSCARCYG